LYEPKKETCRVPDVLEITQTIPTDETEAEESPGKTIESYVANQCSMIGTENKHSVAHDKECDKSVYRRPKIEPDLFPWAVADKIEGIAVRRM
jgi:hypothetical protein